MLVPVLVRRADHPIPIHRPPARRPRLLCTPPLIASRGDPRCAQAYHCNHANGQPIAYVYFRKDENEVWQANALHMR